MKSSITHILFYCLVFAVACNKKPPLFEQLPASQTHVDFVNQPLEKPGLNILSYIYYYNGGGVSAGDINNDGLPDLYFTANSPGQNKLYLNKGNFEFEDITQKAGVAGNADWCTGTTMADVNGDGWLDIYVCAIANMHGLNGKNQLFINNGNNTFTEKAAAYGLDFSGYANQAVFFDYDHDGDLDCFLLNQSEHPNQNIVDANARRGFDAHSGERLFRSELANGGHAFTDVSASAGIYQSNLCYGLGVSVADLNGDGWEDIYVGNDFHENDYYYLNQGNGKFIESGAQHFRHYSRYSMGNDIADFNNDGQPDIVTADMLPGEEKILKTYGNGEHLETYLQKITAHGYQDQYSRNCLQLNNSNGASFSDIGLLSGMSATDWSWSPLLADFDNDGNKDLFMSSGIVKRPLDLDFIMFFAGISDPRKFGSPAELQQTLLDRMPEGRSHPYFFKGDGGYHCTDVSTAWNTADMKGCSNGAAYADLDNDGRLDMVINCIGQPAVILKNNHPRKHFITLGFHGDKLNTNGIGVKAWVFADGKIQYQQLMLTRGFLSSSENRLHFGLDSTTLIDSLLVAWPDQRYQVLRKIKADTVLVINQSLAQPGFAPSTFFPVKTAVLQLNASIQIPWKHKEDVFNDFNVQYLLPHKASTRGPKMAVGDVNKDGLDDVFLCGAKGQLGALFIQQANGNFLPADSSCFVANAASEATGAVFFDANGDGYADLIVVSGGNEYPDGNPELEDHLYLNDGKGHFAAAKNALPRLAFNKTCVSVADIDHDGDQDIFIGGFSGASSYGYAQQSYLLLNDGKANFHLADTSIINLRQAGMVTSSFFTDLNHDGWDDLVIAGEWMPVKIFINNKGTFNEKDQPAATGLWQCLYPADVNGDGNIDFLAGNWGLNSKLAAGKNSPLKLYVKDFAENGRTEQVMAYTIDGKEYAFLGKDQLELPLPKLKKDFLYYREAAGATVQQLMGKMFSGSAMLSAETLASACFINDGKGNFKRQALPDALQVAPIFTFNSFVSGASTWFLAAGNFYGVQPYEGRYDAMNPMAFSFNRQQGSFENPSQFSDRTLEARDMKWITHKNEKRLLLSANNDSLLVMQAPNQTGR